MKRGFTLIELMVVIAVIGILATVIVASINSARVKARNTQRTSDINQLVKAFNLGLGASGNMPPTLPAAGGWWCISETCYDLFNVYSRNAEVDSFVSPYIQFPKDPIGGSRGYGGYLYYRDMPATASISDPSYTFETGSYLLWLLEPPLTSTSCSHGHLYYANANYVECFVKIN